VGVPRCHLGAAAALRRRRSRCYFARCADGWNNNYSQTRTVGAELGKSLSAPHFDAFVAIDWSGAAGKYRGIAVAACRRGRSAPQLVQPKKGTRWTRREIADWLVAQLNTSQRLLIGLDFGFGLPFEPEVGYLGGKGPDIDDIFSLWAHIETKSCGADDFGCKRFVTDSDYASLFWSLGNKPQHWIERKRRTEHACAEATKTYPDTLYKLLGSKQVGKASLTGMRVLHHVRSLSAGRVAIWPFEKVRTSAMVEIYPTMFRKRAAGKVAKIAPADLNRALKELGSQPITRVGSELSDHETDALLSAAGLRLLASAPEAWSHPELATSQVQREGWIFGV
jgi:hypothetical protein